MNFLREKTFLITAWRSAEKATRASTGDGDAPEVVCSLHSLPHPSVLERIEHSDLFVELA